MVKLGMGHELRVGNNKRSTPNYDFEERCRQASLESNPFCESHAENVVSFD